MSLFIVKDKNVMEQGSASFMTWEIEYKQSMISSNTAVPQNVDWVISIIVHII